MIYVNQKICYKSQLLKQYYVKNQGCRPTCHINQQKYLNGVCEPYPIYNFLSFPISQYKTVEQFKWQIIYDFDQLTIGLPENKLFEGYYVYGIFKQKQGIFRVLTLPSSQGSFMVAITVELILFNRMPPLSNIQFFINDTYYGQLQSDSSGLVVADKLFRYWIDPKSDVIYDGISYNNNLYNILYIYANVSNTFIIKIIGNITDANAGWGLRSLNVYSGYCPSNCKKCLKKFTCDQCWDGYLKSKWGTCSQCQGSYQQKINSTHCMEDDDETIYSKYIVKEFTGLELDLETYQEYTLVQQIGLNFMKGQGIFYSVWKSQFRMFGGPFIWAQAKFERTVQIDSPHYAITISFIIVFGPSFPEDGLFIFSLDNQIQIELSSSNSVEIPIQHKQIHNQTQIIIGLECNGTNNEPIYAFCGLYQLYITVHQCKPDCNLCQNDQDCLDPLVQPTITCTNGQFLEQLQQQCQNCPSSCQTCTSFYDCITCFDTFINPTLGCVCASNQYLENDKCTNCSPNCNQCINSQKCTECTEGLFRKILDNQCVCQDSYFESENPSICKKCGQNCLKCSSDSQCEICFKGYDLNAGICTQKPYTYYSQTLDKYLNCPDVTNCPPCQDTNNTCFCGDTIIAGNEYCDDGNSIQYDGCYDCKFQCQPQCTKCIEGICYECATQGWYLDVSQNQIYTCKEVCWDGLVTGTEKCDDAISTSNCKNCQFYCLSDCLECNYKTGLCDVCREGLIGEKNYCKNICGDGIRIYAPDLHFTEQCDDGNIIENDGCSKTCQFQCQSNQICDQCQNNKCLHCVNKYKLNISLNRCECSQSCLQCDLVTGKGCLLCKDGFTLVDFQCQSICGDSKITEFEQCDDGNMIFGDGCHQCQLSCEFQCLHCIYGNCIKCSSGYQSIDGRCQEINDFYQIIQSLQIYDEIYQNDKLQSFYQDYEYSTYLNRISLDSLEQKSLQYIQNNENIYFTYVYVSHNYSILQIFFEKALKIIDYLNNHQNILYSNCFNYDEQILENCITLNKQEGFLIKKMSECSINNSIDENYKYCNGNGFECLQNCPINCQFCLKGSCLICQSGYTIDIIGNSCNSICGDNFITLEELCDDGNNVINDGCSLCQFSCQQECADCQFGQCKQCKPNYYFDIKKGNCFDITTCNEQKGLYYNNDNNQCFTKCGDSIKAGTEQCDDGNLQQYDGCFGCKFECNQNCIVCKEQGCEECQIGYKLQQSDCIIDCGDGLILGEEKCDDGNTLKNDGCTNCQIDSGYRCQTINWKSFCFLCNPECSDCEFRNGQIFCLNCNPGYFLNSGACIQCSENCKECQNTPNNCTLCKIENCQKCDNKEGYYNDFESKKCITVCGDGIMAGIEQCDDGNNLNQDGCNSKCLFEKGYQCVQNQCIPKEEKSIYYGYSNSSTADCLLLKSEINFSNQIKVVIEHFKNTEFNYSLQSIQSNSTMQANSVQELKECQIQFQFFKTITEINLIHILIPLSTNQSRILDEEDIREIILTPRKQVYYDSTQKAQAQTVVSTSNQLTFLLQLIGPLTIILGGLNFFWKILDILTWINNFYFLNVDYPLNVKLFFQKLQWDDIFNIPEFIQLNQPEDTYYFEAPPKFNEKNINPLLINNIQVFCSLIIFAILLYCITLLFINLIEKKFKNKNFKENQYKSSGITVFTVCYQESNIQKQGKSKSKEPVQEQLQRLPSVIAFIFRQSYEYKLTFLSKIFSIIDLLLLDIFMACILQLTCDKKQEHYIVKINDFLAILGLILIFIIYKLYEYVSSKHKLLLNHFIFQRKFSTLYDGINFENKVAKKYCYFNLIRKISFIIFIVTLYEKPILQTTFCCLSCFINQAFLLYQNPFNSKIGLIQTAIPDFCIFCIILLSVLLSLDDMSTFLSFDQKYNIGWVIVFLIGLSILIQLIFLLIEFFQNLLSNLQGLKKLLCK